MFRALLHFLILAATVAPAFAQVFKWVDDRGVTHYGERPPRGGKATEVPDRLGSPAVTTPRASPPAGAQDSRPVPAQQDPCDTQRELLARLRQNLIGQGPVTLENSDAIARQEKLVAERCQGR
ncbi:MAG TPA: DUF4124 domain-containing protein [Burkholderiales bacterium]|nr:DUF4124 domain-containing protein [Burkholderiales bacterium]